MTARPRSRTALVLALAALVLGTPLMARAAATIVILNADGPGEGFNDPAPRAPVGGNTGTTLGAQRAMAFNHAASIWGAELDSTVTILIRATFDPLSCTATGAVLGSAGANWVARNFPGAPLANTWYSGALANKLFGTDIVPGAQQINARFNSNLGAPGCLTGSFFYLGLDNVVPAGQINLVAVLLHEFAHGLGFQTFTSGTTGAYFVSAGVGTPTVYDHFLLDKTTGKKWTEMTDAERVASAINPRKLVWNGMQVTDDAPSVLATGTPRLYVDAPASAVATYPVGAASFGPPLFSPGTSGELMPLTGATGSNQLLACEALNAGNAAAVNLKIALIDRGVCTFVIKVKNAQNAGALGVIIADNVASSLPAGLGGSDPTIMIPSIRVTQATGNTLKSLLRFRSRLHSGVFTTLGLDLSTLAGAYDSSHQVLMYTPNPFEGGSSVSHWDTIAFPNLLMEPAINSDLTQSVKPPQDLTKSLLKDIGW